MKDDAGKSTRATFAHDAEAAPSAMSRDIDDNLKRVYQMKIDEAVPDRFRALLAQLREKEGKPE